MSVNVQASSDNGMQEPLDSLKSTTNAMHRIQFEISTEKQWYDIMREARVQFGKNWRSQPRFKRKLVRYGWNSQPHWCWFDVPDLSFASWVSVKLSLRSKIDSTK